MLEHKFIDLKALKVSGEGPGSIEGYRSVFGVIDEGGDITIKGAFADSADDYMHSGFSAESHIWNFKDSVGFPVEAYEDDHGWFVKSQFHTTQGAQDVRTIAQERMDAGKQVGFSFGYQVDEYEFIEPKDYKAKLPVYVKAEFLPDMLQKAQKFSRVRVLKKVSAIEDSLVTRGMNRMAAATSVKSLDGVTPEAKGIFEDVIEEREESLYFLFDCLCSALYRAQYMADLPSASVDLGTAIDEILAEFSARVRAAYVEPADESEIEPVEVASLRGPISFKGDLRDRLPFAKHAEAVRDAVEAFANRSTAVMGLVSELSDRRKQIDGMRETKIGATYSGSNSAHMQRIHDAIGKLKKDVSSVHSDMAALIDKGKKKSDEPGLDTATLRTQSLRAQSMALRALN
jgi:HK97 family phage prohead protease